MFKILSGLFMVCAFAVSACSHPFASKAAADTAASSSATPALAAGNYALTLAVDGLQRKYILHVPPQVNQGVPLPLLVVLHGSYGTGREMQVGLGFDTYADARGFYTAYPNAYQAPGRIQTARWNDGRGTLASSTANIDDVKFITSMIDAIAAQVPLEKSRVYLTGASNGGMMAYRLGCETGSVFAGIAPVIGNIPVPIYADCATQEPIDFLSINGGADPFIPLDGGTVCENVRFGCEGGTVVSREQSVDKFASVDGCSLQPVSETLPVLVNDGTRVEKLTYPKCQNGTQVVSYIVQNGGHAWPPRRPQVPSAGKQTGNLDATQVIVDFFLPG